MSVAYSPVVSNQNDVVKLIRCVPVPPKGHGWAMLTMSRTDAIPFETMRAGTIWNWVAFPEWLDTLERIPKGVNCLRYMPLAPLMIWTMELEADKGRPATDAERREMQRALREAIDADAYGFSAQRQGEHSVQADHRGTSMVTDTKADEHLLALARVLRQRDEDFIQITQHQHDNPQRERAFEDRLAVSGHPVLYNTLRESYG